MAKREMIPPDGGWGWVVAVAYGLNNMIMIPMLQGFGFVLKDVFKKLHVPGIEATIILSVNSAFGMGLGLVHGPLLRKFGYRKIALVGSTMFTTAIILTAFATTFTHFIISYGLMASLGVALTMASFSLAVNSFFGAKRGRAVGMAMTITGLGPILMPQLISYLLSSYGTQGTIIILGGLTLHSLVGTALLQPVKWHAIWRTIEPENEQSNSIKESKDSESAKEEHVTIDTENESIRRRSSTAINDEKEGNKNSSNHRGMNTHSEEQDHSHSGERTVPFKWWNSAMSLESVNLGSCSMIFDDNMKFGSLTIQEDTEEIEESPSDLATVSSRNNFLDADEKLLSKEISEAPGVQEKLKDDESCSRLKKVWRSIVRFFDFDLLRDPIYVNMMLGMSIAQFAEINFAILTPMILGDMEFSNAQIANVMSTLAGVDLVSRGLAPFIGEWLKLPARHMALISLCLLIGCRTMLIFTRSFGTVILVAIGLGFAKGIRAVNMFLVVPNYIPIERLASATGIQMLVNGIVLMILGPFLGFSRDKFGSYVPCLVLINSTTALTIIMWITEMLIVRRRTKKRERK